MTQSGGFWCEDEISSLNGSGSQGAVETPTEPRNSTARGPRRSSQVHLGNHPSSAARRASVTLLRSWKSLSDFSSFYAHPLSFPRAWKAGYAQACACAGLVGTYYATKPSLRVSRWQPSGNPPSPLQTLRISSQTRQILENIARCIIPLWPRSTRRRSVLRQ